MSKRKRFSAECRPMACMKVLKILLCLLAGPACLFMLVIYQSCRPVRHCNIISGIYGSYFNEITDHTLADSAVVKATDFGIAVAFMQMSYQCREGSSFSLISTAYAYKPDMDAYNMDTITSITISSDRDFDAAHPAGASLNDLFTIPDLSVINTSNAYYQNAFGFNLYLNHAPASEQYHRFTVNATTQSSSKVYSYPYGAIKLIP